MNITNSGYERHLEAIAFLSVPSKNATLEVKARCDGLLLEARLIARHTGNPFPFQLHPFAYRKKPSGSSTYTAITVAHKGKNSGIFTESNIWQIF